LCIIDGGSEVEQARAFRLVQDWPALRFAIGIHPHQAGIWDGRLDEATAIVARALDEQPAACAVGEIGLDYHYDFSPRDVQRDVLRRQLVLARARTLPVVIHAREADEDVLAALKDAGRPPIAGVMHCFTGTLDFARRSLDLGLHISLAGIVTFPKADALREVARYVPEDRLLIETDSPYLAPVPNRGKRNEPAWVVHVAGRLAETRGTSLARLAEETTVNYTALFGPIEGSRTKDEGSYKE
jgi:TatD DNase family protein